jgi:hypothetical protein
MDLRPFTMRPPFLSATASELSNDLPAYLNTTAVFRLAINRQYERLPSASLSKTKGERKLFARKQEGVKRWWEGAQWDVTC